MTNVGAHRRFLSRSAAGVIRASAGLDARTVSSFFRVYRASVLRRGYERYGDRFIRESGFACKAELLSKLSSMSVHIEEVDVGLDTSKRVGDSKMPVLKTIFHYWRLMARQRLARDPSPA